MRTLWNRPDVFIRCGLCTQLKQEGNYSIGNIQRHRHNERTYCGECMKAAGFDNYAEDITKSNNAAIRKLESRLSDKYVKDVICKRLGISHADVPIEVLPLYRSLLLVKRKQNIK